jgi:hypothetical protein
VAAAEDESRIRRTEDWNAMGTFIDYDRFEALVETAAKWRHDLPWYAVPQLLHEEKFQQLYEEFPDLSLFEEHKDLPREHNQRGHNRFYLAYEKSIYHAHMDSGVAKRPELPAVWQAFMTELEEARYTSLTAKFVGRTDFYFRYAWHIGVTGSEVPPHLDSDAKLGTHMFYFNTMEDWDPAWGGSPVLLLGITTAANNPEWADFALHHEDENRGNRSLLFRNTPVMWHGYKPLRSPPGHLRRSFNVIAAPNSFQYGRPGPKETNRILNGPRER